MIIEVTGIGPRDWSKPAFRPFIALITSRFDSPTIGSGPVTSRPRPHPYFKSIIKAKVIPIIG
jgi:hypothetical protein